MTRWRRPVAVGFAMVVAIIAGYGSLLVAADGPESGVVPRLESGPAWDRVFDVDGSVRDRLAARAHGGLDAVFLEDRVSDGTLVDISALRRSADPAESLVLNGTVAAPHDLGNAYVVAHAAGRELALDVRVERLAGDADDESYIEIELNRDLVSVTSGHRFPSIGPDGSVTPGYALRYPFRGERSADDVLIRAHLRGAQVVSVDFERWEAADGAAGYQRLEAIENVGGETCFGIPTFYSICGGALESTDGRPAYIANGDPEQPYAPDSYLELSLNVSRLMRSAPDFTTVLVSSPEDIAFGTFKTSGRFASPSTDTGRTRTRRHTR